MKAKNTSTSLTSSDKISFESVFRYVLKKHQQNIDNRIPAQVLDYDREKNRVTVQPLIQILGNNGQIIDRAPIQGLPVLRYGAGGALISFPIKKGDLGYIWAGDRDASLVEQNKYQPQIANTARMHSFENGIFVPDHMQNWSPPQEDEEKLYIGFGAGSVKITLGAESIEIKAQKKIHIRAEALEIEGDLTLKGGLEVQKDSNIKGALNVAGGIKGQKGISLETHIHAGVSPGGSMTTIPQ